MYVGDPDTEPERWFIEGGPLGILDFPKPRNIFPEYSNAEAATDPSMLLTTAAEESRSNAERDPDAIKEINSMVQRGWIKRFWSKVRAKAFVKGRLIYSKLIVITKDKPKKALDGTMKRSIKERLILNLKKSGVAAASAKTERPELPRVLDVVLAVLTMMSLRTRPGAKVRQLVLDFQERLLPFPGEG